MPQALEPKRDSFLAINRWPRAVGIFLIKCYQRGSTQPWKWFGVEKPRSCRFTPTCSRYTSLAIEKYGLLKGSWMGLKRIARCHPWSPGGHDPVP